MKMKVHENFQLFWDDFTSRKPNEHGFFDEQIVKILHTPDQKYYEQRQQNKDGLGFQPLFVMFANPITQKTDKVLIKNVNDKLANDFRQYVRNQYVSELDKKFGTFTPDATDGYTEYDSWNSFEKSWFMRENGPVFDRNIPLLFDHISDVEYWTRKQTGEKVFYYQRLLVTTFLVAESKFYTFFIKDVNDTELGRIKLLVQSRIGLEPERMFRHASS